MLKAQAAVVLPSPEHQLAAEDARRRQELEKKEDEAKKLDLCIQHLLQVKQLCTRLAEPSLSQATDDHNRLQVEINRLRLGIGKQRRLDMWNEYLAAQLRVINLLTSHSTKNETHGAPVHVLLTTGVRGHHIDLDFVAKELVQMADNDWRGDANPRLNDALAEIDWHLSNSNEVLLFLEHRLKGDPIPHIDVSFFSNAGLRRDRLLSWSIDDLMNNSLENKQGSKRSSKPKKNEGDDESMDGAEESTEARHHRRPFSAGFGYQQPRHEFGTLNGKSRFNWSDLA